ncbi:hypothetical protein Tco_0738745 [Tanacetum coccineum]
MFPRRSEGEELEYPFFEGDGSSSDEWRDYGMAGDDYEGPPIFDDDQYEEESMPVYDTDIEDVIEEEEGFIEKGGFGGKEDNIEDVVVVANDLCSSMIQTTLNVDFEEDINTKSHELVSFAKSIIIKMVEDNDVVSKEGSRNSEWVKISMRKVHTLLETEDNDDRKVCLYYLCIDLNYVEEQRSNLLTKHRNLVHGLNTCKEHLLVLKQAKLDFLTMQYVNTKIIKENKHLRTELKELKAITQTWLNSSNKVNQCISKQIPSQKKRIIRVDQLSEDPSSSRQKHLVFVKSSADDTKVSIPGVERPWLSQAEGFILPNHDTNRILLAESQRNTTDPSVTVTDSSMTDYDLADESLVCSTPLPTLKKLDGVEPISGPKTIKSILRSKYTFKAEALKHDIINEPTAAPPKGNKSSSTSKVHSTPASKLKSVKIKDDPPLVIVMKELNDLKLKISNNQSSHSKNNQPQQVLFYKKCERTDHKTCDHAEYISTKNLSQHLKSLGRSSSRAKHPRPSKHFFPPCIHCGFSDHLFDV